MQRVAYLYERRRLFSDVLYQVEVCQRLEETDERWEPRHTENTRTFLEAMPFDGSERT